MWEQEWVYAPIMDFYLKKMKESGQMGRLWTKWKASPPVGCLGEGAEALEPRTVMAVFIILAFAIATSLAIFLMELLLR